MGGNVFKNAIRLSAEAYHKIASSIDCKHDYCYNRMKVIKSYHNKESFGDIDILVHSVNSDQDCSDDEMYSCLNVMLALAGLKLKRDCEVNHKEGVYSKYVRNGNITSYGIDMGDNKVFQLDIIRQPHTSFDFAYNYFSYNDLGNFIGRYAHKYGLKFGHNGLFYSLHFIEENGNNMFLGDICLTTDYSKALEFLGFNSDIIYQGFDSMEEIYEFVTDHPMFYIDMFNLKNVSHDARVRDKKRQSYSGLLKFVEDNRKGFELCNKISSKFLKKSEYLPTIEINFKNFKNDVETLVAKHLVKKELKRRWNGKIIMEQSMLAKFSLYGNDLRQFDNAFKLTDTQLLKMTDNEIKSYIFDRVVELGSLP